jgi:aspartate kinase
MGIVVQKFGGTSLSDAMKINLAARKAIRTQLEGNQVVMTVSAMGKTTDELVALAEQITPHPPRREMDVLLSTGEQISMSLMAMAIHAAGYEAMSFTGGQMGMITDRAHTKARIQKIEADRLKAALDAGKIAIVAGFQGVTEEGWITTLGRGGSDTTAVAIAAALHANRCEIYTDVEGIFTTDPRIVPEARKIDEITYDEILELASLGAGVMHSRSIEFGKKFNVPIHVRSSLTDTPGTKIVAETQGMEDIVVRGATLKRDLTAVVLIGVPNSPGAAAKIFARLAEHNLVVDDIMQNVYENGKAANIGFTTTASDAEEAKAVCQKICDEMGLKGFELDEKVSKVSVVGVGMRTHTGVASRLFTALAEGQVNIRHISTSEIVISVVVEEKDGEKALKLVHNAFELHKSS